MPSPQHAAWIRSGQQWRLARPLAALRDRLRRYGYTVYDIGDNRHLDHIPPEDHTPYSETGWPGTTPYGWVTAIDIMPPEKPGLPSLQALGGRIYADMQSGYAGVQWLKYMNWGPSSNNTAVHDRWEPTHERSSSGDAGHAHLSCRSDATAWTQGDTYDPVARARGQMGDLMTGPIPGAWDDYLPDTVLAILTGTTPRFGYPDATGPAWDNDALANHNLQAVETRLMVALKEIAEKLVAAPPPAVDLDALAEKVAAKLGQSYFTATTTVGGRILPGAPPVDGASPA
jgi:hypothetical protein